MLESTKGLFCFHSVGQNEADGHSVLTFVEMTCVSSESEQLQGYSTVEPLTLMLVPLLRL